VLQPPAGVRVPANLMSNINGLMRHPRLRLVVYLGLAKLCVFLPPIMIQKSLAGLAKLNAWDSLIFEGIAENGYIKPEYYAFSPVYPAIIRMLHLSLGLSYSLGAFLATNVLSFVFPLLVYEAFGYTAALLTEFLPTYIVFTTVPYSDVIALIGIGASMVLLLKDKVDARVGACLSLAVTVFYSLTYTLPAYLILAVGGGVRSSINRMLKIYLLPLMSLLGVVLWYRQVHGAFYYFALEHDIWGVSFATPIQQAQWILNTKGTGWFTSQDWYVLGVRLTPTYWYARNLVFEAFYFIGIALLIWKTSHPARLFLAFYCATVEVPLLFIVGTPAISIPRLLLPAYPAVYGYAATINKQWVKVYLAVCIVCTIWVTLSQAYAFFS